MATKPRISAPSHHKKRPDVPVMPPAPHRIALPPPPVDMPPAAAAEWLRIGPQLEVDGLRELDLPVVEAFCYAAADLGSARRAWIAEGAPQYVERTAGLRAHPALAIIRALGVDVLRFRGALVRPLVPQLQGELDDDARHRLTAKERETSDRFFTGH